MKGLLLLMLAVMNISVIEVFSQSGHGYKPQHPAFFKNYYSDFDSRKEKSSSRQMSRDPKLVQEPNYRSESYFDENLPYRNPENAYYNNYRKDGHYQGIKQKVSNDIKRMQYRRETTTASPSFSKVKSVEDYDDKLLNSKFLGEPSDNEESEKTLARLGFQGLKKKLGYLSGTKCFARSSDKEEGRFLWDLNIYNYYSDNKNLCNNGGLLGDEIVNPVAVNPSPVYYRPKPFLQNFWGWLIPGGILNPIGGNRPVYGSNQIHNDPIQSNPADAVVNPLPNYPQYLYNDGGAAVIPVNNLTPGQIVGGVASTVNSIIQQLSGNIPRPVRSV